MYVNTPVDHSRELRQQQRQTKKEEEFVLVLVQTALSADHWTAVVTGTRRSPEIKMRCSRRLYQEYVGDLVLTFVP